MQRAEQSQMRANRARWDESVAHHLVAPMYDLPGFRAGGPTLIPIELDLAGSVRGRSLLHLQCHFGQDTLSWARRGARVTGVDYSPKAIEAARSLAGELNILACFVLSNIYDLPRHLRGRFEVVYTGKGVLCWLPDLRAWAKVVARFLAPGGRFVLVDDHPCSDIFKNDAGVRTLELDGNYFPRRARRWVGEGTYATSARFRHKVSYEWVHPVSEVISALVGAGLRLEKFEEYPYTYWHKFPFLEQRRDGYWHLPGAMSSIPLMFSLRARA